MRKLKGEEWGARIERGRVTGWRDEDGKRLYAVESFDRPGAAFYEIEGGEHDEGETVCFFAFEDGKGKIV